MTKIDQLTWTLWRALWFKMSNDHNFYHKWDVGLQLKVDYIASCIGVALSLWKNWIVSQWVWMFDLTS
jgi:hypothetical protein